MNGDTRGDDERTYDAKIDEEIDDPAPSRGFRLRPNRAKLITDAKKSNLQSRRHRQRWYTILQLSRLPTMALSGMAYFWWDNLFLTVFFFVLAVPAPALAVIFANEKGEKLDKRTRNTYKPGVARQIQNAQIATAQRRAQLESSEPSNNSKPVVIDHEEIRPDD